MRFPVLFALLFAAVPALPASLDLQPYRNRVVLLDFWASWCTPCHASLPWLDAMQRKYGGQGLSVVTVNLDQSRAEAATFMQTIAFQLPVVYDPEGDIARRYGLLAMPTSVLIDRQGRIRYRHQGFLQTKTDEYEKHLRDLLRD